MGDSATTLRMFLEKGVVERLRLAYAASYIEGAVVVKPPSVIVTTSAAQKKMPQIPYCFNHEFIQ